MQIIEMEVYLEAFIGCTPLHIPSRVELAEATISGGNFDLAIGFVDLGCHV